MLRHDIMGCRKLKRKRMLVSAKSIQARKVLGPWSDGGDFDSLNGRERVRLICAPMRLSSHAKAQF